MRRFNAMVDRCRDRIYRFAYYSVGGHGEAEDVTQEVLIRLWQHWSGIDEQRAMAWIMRVTRNICVDMLRKRRTHEAWLAANSGRHSELGPSSPAIDPLVELERQDLRQQVKRALCDIGEPYRSVVILRELEDMPYARIAEVLEMPLNSVKVNLHRGRRMLRDRLRDTTWPHRKGQTNEAI